MAIQIRRGDYDEMDANALLDGELCATTQDDPNVSDGRGFYIKNGTLKRVLTDDDLGYYKPYTLLDTINLSSATSSVSLLTTSADYNEYIIIVNGTITSATGYLLLMVGGNTYTGETPVNTSLNKSASIKRLVDNDGLVSYDGIDFIRNINNKQVSLEAYNTQIASGTVIKIYAR